MKGIFGAVRRPYRGTEITNGFFTSFKDNKTELRLELCENYNLCEDTYGEERQKTLDRTNKKSHTVLTHIWYSTNVLIEEVERIIG